MQNLYQHKELNLDVVILCPDCNVGKLKTTLSSIKYSYPGSSCLCAVPGNSPQISLQEVQKLGKVVLGKDTITSLINVALTEAADKWQLIVVSGTWIRPLMDRKYSYFVETDKDVLFPVVHRKMNFVDATVNGILLHKKSFVEVGTFPETHLEEAKLLWCLEAMEKGYKFKAIVGTKLG